MVLDPTRQDKRHGATRIEPNEDGSFLSKHPAGDKPVLSGSHLASRATHDASGSSSGGGGGSLSLTGTVGHNQTVTVTDSESRFGTRTNVKPVYVNLGDALAGNTLGRDTGNYWGAEVELTTAQLNGSMTSAIRYDFKPSFQPSFDDLDMPDVNKPFITYTERYYDFDTTLSQYQNSSGGFNLKTNRPHHPGFSPNNNAYIGYQGSEGGNCRMVIENVDSFPANRNFYSAGNPPPFQWISEEVTFEHSTLNTYDGDFRHVRNNTLLNADQVAFMTIDDGNPTKFARMRLDQVSNGCGSGVSNVWGYFGYINIDDEYRGVYVSDTNDPDTATRLVRLPQSAWSAGSAEVLLLQTELTLSSSYLLIRTGKETWVNDALFLGDF